jgi:PAS domain S-box-containing protein
MKQLLLENEHLRQQLGEAEDALRALSAGEVDAVFVEADRKQVYTLETADKPYRLLVEQMPQAAATLTVEGIILYGNGRFASLLGRPLNALVGKSLRDFLPADNWALFESLLHDARKGEVRGEVNLQRGDGTSVPAYLGVSALREGALGVCLVVTDLTEQRHYVELKRAQEALREAERRKDEFLAMLAHELRNPLGPVRNAAQFLKVKGPQDPEFRNPVEMIVRQSGLLARLLDDLLDVSRISRNVLELRRERLVLSEIIDAAVDVCRDEIEARGHSLRVIVPKQRTEVEADGARLIQVLHNLLVNAAKYTPLGGKIELTVTAHDGILTVSVRDNGIGISREKLSEVFELFVQVDRSSDREGGLGIGLTLVRQLVNLHGGSIEARSQGVGRGSEFVLRLPVVVAGITSTTNPASSPAASPRRILVADDNHDAVESLAVLLEEAGHVVYKAFDGESAIAYAQQARPEVALLDIGMPKGNGYEVARRIREHPWGKQVFLVALTGWGKEGDKQHARQAGFDIHVVKPVDPVALNRLIASIGDVSSESSSPTPVAAKND